MDKDINNTKIIIRIRGGLGNQLFGYAFGRKLSLDLKSELILDSVTAFKKYDPVYKRKFALDKFNTIFTHADKKYQLDPYEKLKRNFLKFFSLFKNFENKVYIENFKFGFDERFLKLNKIKERYLDGMWQSEKYFKDIKNILIKELTPKQSLDLVNQSIISDIKSSNSVGIHIRWFDDLESSEYHNIDKIYYMNSINQIKKKLEKPKFFIFSDYPSKVKHKIDLSQINYKIIDNNLNENDNYKDLLLMKECKNFIIANSTFSWWAAWLNTYDERIIICPMKSINFDHKVTAWGFKDQIPDEWIKV